MIEKDVYNNRVCNEEIIEDTSDKLGYSINEVKGVLNSIHEYILNHIQNEDVETLRLPYIGSFQVNPYRRWAMAHSKKNQRLDKLRKNGFDIADENNE